MEGFIEPTPKKGLTPEEKQRWNSFVDFVEKNNMKGSPLLDVKNKSVGTQLIQKYNLTYPDKAIPPTIIPQVQQEIQNSRKEAVDLYRKDKTAFTPDVKSEDDIMKNISPVDGWPGSKTLSHKFPVAVAIKTTPVATTTKNYGTDIESYNRDTKKQ